MNFYLESQDEKDKLYQRIRNHIISLELKPGEMFSEASIAEKLDAGRVAVREVITQLNDEGYVEVFAQKGTFVSRIDLEKIRQAVYAHTVLEQAVIEEVMTRGLTGQELTILREVLEEQKAAKEQENIIGVILKEYQIMYHLSDFCDRSFIWDFFKTLDCHLLRVQYLQHSTFAYQMQMSSLTNIENALVESRLLIDNLARGDKGAAILSCSNRYTKIMWQADMIRSIYPQYFSE